MAFGLVHSRPGAKVTHPDPARLFPHHHYPFRAVWDLRVEIATRLGWQLPGRENIWVSRNGITID